MTLTSEENDALATLDSKLDHIRDGVRGVVREFHAGLFIHGEGGTSKSFTVTQQLELLKTNYKLHNTRMTGRGLVDALRRAPADVHFIEDAETMLDDKKAWGVLRSALWSQSDKMPMERPVTWEALHTVIDFTFTGGLIVVSNTNLAESIAEIRAIKSRIKNIGIDFSGEEIKALMKQICLSGFRYGELFLDPVECLEVRQHVIDRLSELRRSLDLRLLINGFRDYLQWKHGESKLDWRQLLDGRMSERATAEYRDRRTKNAEKHRVALEIDAMEGLTWKDKCEMAKERLGISPAAFDRARKRKV